MEFEVRASRRRLVEDGAGDEAIGSENDDVLSLQCAGHRFLSRSAFM